MKLGPDITRIAALLGDPPRANMLSALMGGQALTAGELAREAGVTPQTASAHLAKLLAQGLVGCMAQGKHRYYRLAGAEVGQALEAMLVLAGLPRPRFEPSTPPALRQARRCYDHLAGHWGVRLHDHTLRQRWMTPDPDEARGYRCTDEGLDALRALGVDVAAATGARRRRLACACMDWSERRPHLGGALGAAWLQAMLAQDWLDPDPDSRALRVTRRGQARLERLLEDTTT